MREKHMREKKLEIWENDQILWKNDDDGTRVNEFEKKKKNQFKQRALHLKIENNMNNVLFLFLEKIKRKTRRD